MVKKKEKEKYENVLITIHPSVLKRLDKMAVEMDMSRSGFITFMVNIQGAMDENKDLAKLMEGAFKGIMKKLTKP